MKRVFSLTVVFVIFLFCYQLAVVFFNNGHEINYLFQSNRVNYEITEKMFIEKKQPIYHIKIQLDHQTFLFENKTNYNKQKKIITDIRFFEADGYQCIYPIYKNNLSDIHDIQCVKDEKQYTYTSLKEQHPNLVEFQKQLMNEQIILPSWNPLEDPVKMFEFNVYQKAIPKNIYIPLWRYQGIEVVSQNSDHFTSLLETDSYQSKGVLVDQYYIIPKFDSTPEVSSITISDVTLFGEEEIELDGFKISDDCYFNGVVDGKAYLFDRTNMKQYEINPKEKLIREIGNTTINAQYYDGIIWSDRNIYDFSKKLTFEKDYSNIPELMQYQPKQIHETNNSYYFATNDGSVYRLYKEEMSHPILLLYSSEIKELSVVNDFVFYISGDTLYCYHDIYGLRPLVINNEFRYNTDLYAVYQK